MKANGKIFLKGYTLIEIMVGLSIISLLFLGGYSGYQEFTRRQILDNTAAELISNLNLIKQKALSGDQSSLCTDLDSQNTLEGYQVSFSSNSYTISPRCKNIQLGLSYSVNITLPQSITLSYQSFENPLIFNTLSGTNLDNTLTITLTHVSGSTKVLFVSKVGVSQ